MNKYVAPIAQQIELELVDILLTSSCPLDFGGESWDDVEGQSQTTRNTPV